MDASLRDLALHPDRDAAFIVEAALAADPAEAGLMLADGLDEALIGYARRGARPVAVYDRDRAIEVLAAEFADEAEGADEAYTDAVEHFDFNVAGGWVGEGTPVFLVASCGTCGEARESCACERGGPWRYDPAQLDEM